MALTKGLRGLPGGDSLARLLARKLGVRNLASVPPLTEDQILGWADEYHRRTGRWPRVAPEPVAGAPGETWRLLDNALRDGLRGLPGGSSLPRLLAERRGARNKSRLPRLTLRQIRGWAAAHRRRTGRWPGPESGPVAEAPGETWKGIYMALYQGLRGLPGGMTLRQLLGGDARRGKEP
jgi:hypothetical protein